MLWRETVAKIAFHFDRCVHYAGSYETLLIVCRRYTRDIRGRGREEKKEFYGIELRDDIILAEVELFQNVSSLGVAF